VLLEFNSRLYFDKELKIVLKNNQIIGQFKVISLIEVVGILDYFTQNALLSILRVDQPGGSYNEDLSLRL
jgi:hypothetical protein